MPMKLHVPLLVALALAAALPAPAPAVIPPKDCGTVKVKRKTHRIKADGVSCRFARAKAVRYLRSGKRPGSGWKCRRYPRDNAFSFRCERGTTRVIYGIKKR